MKRWLLKFRVSSHLDSGSALPGGLQRQVDASPDLASFVSTERKLRTLLGQRPRTEPPSWLHARVMAEIRAEARESAPAPVWRVPAWVVPTAAVAVVALVIWMAQVGSHPVAPVASASGSGFLPAAAQALDAGQEVKATVAATLVGPLEDELARVNRDIEEAAAVVLASLP